MAALVLIKSLRRMNYAQAILDIVSMICAAIVLRPCLAEAVVLSVSNRSKQTIDEVQ